MGLSQYVTSFPLNDMIHTAMYSVRVRRLPFGKSSHRWLSLHDLKPDWCGDVGFR